MTVLSAQSIDARVRPSHDRHTRPDWWQMEITPYEPVEKQALGMSYGLTAAGYDIRVGELGKDPLKNSGGSTPGSLLLQPGGFALVASLERVRIPHDLQVIVHDKSSWARRALAIQNTVLEPGWHGWITLELSNHGSEPIRILRGQPIAQLVFHQLDRPTSRPYKGKYQNQGSTPVESIYMEDLNGEPTPE